MLCVRKILPISFLILQFFFTFTTVQSICRGFSVSWNSSVNSRFSESSSSSRRRAEQNAGCHWSFFCFYGVLFFICCFSGVLAVVFFDSSFSNCSPYIICSFCIFFNAQNDMGAKGMLAPVSCKIYLVLSYKNIQMGFLAETATEKRYIYHNIRTRF